MNKTKHLVKKIFLVALLSSSSASAAISLKGLTPAKNYIEAAQGRDERAKRFFEFWAKEPLAPPTRPPGQGWGNDEFLQTHIARLALRTDLAAVSASLLTPTFKPWLPGSDFQIPTGLCKRVGDYDFVLQALLKIAYYDRVAGKTLLTQEARQKLYYELLSVKGVEHHGSISIGGCLTILDTENHILSTEVSRYLTNQILFNEGQLQGRNLSEYDNQKNGFKEWMLNHLADFLKNDFSEFNSRPYEGVTIIALLNIYDYAEDRQVKLMAQMVLDYLSAKFAVGSNGMRRMVPFRRMKRHLNSNMIGQDDFVITHSFITVGNYYNLIYMNNGQLPDELKTNTFSAFHVAASSYRVPDIIADLQINKDASYLQMIRHSDAEIFASSKSFMLTAGGRYRDVADFLTGQNDAWGVASTVIPTQGEIELKNLFYILGDQTVSKRNNLCVTKNFICGLNLHIPENLPAGCEVKNGKFRFYNMKACKGYDFYVAMYKDKPMPDWDRENMSFGLFEVQEATMPFEYFMQKTVTMNSSGQLRANRPSTYTTYDGQKIEFRFYPLSLESYPIHAIDGVAQETSISKWPRALGQVMSSQALGRFEIVNKRLGKKLTLDGSNHLQPVRTEAGL